MKWRGCWSAGSTNNATRHHLRKTRWHKPWSMLIGWAASSSGSWSRMGSAGVPSITATWLPRLIGSTWTMGLCHILLNRCHLGSWVFSSTTSILCFNRLSNMDVADLEPYKGILVCRLDIIPTDKWYFIVVKYTLKHHILKTTFGSPGKR